MNTTEKIDAKSLPFELDDLSVRMDMGIHNLAYIIEAAEERELDETLASSFTCVLDYLRSLQKELRRKADQLIAAKKEDK